MIKKILFLLFSVSFLVAAQPKEEVRAVWLTTVFNLDWPTTTGPSSQKNEMIKLLDLLKKTNMNTIMLQVRARGDVLYPSKIEPWAKCLTGNIGNNPGYDPLQFIIEEAHKRGIEVHAWWVTYKAYGSGTPPNTNPKHVVLKHPELCKLYANEWWMDPGIPETKTYLLNLAMELIRNYDIDGIHFDFARYPGTDFQDNQTYETYGNGQNKADWRRNNITQFIYAIYDSVNAVKPMLKVGSAPIGIYQNLSACLSGWESYSNVYQDSRRWLLARKHDYESPQIYWDINSCPRFDSLAINWINNANGRHIYPGIAVYRMGGSDGNWPAEEIIAQIDSTRKFGGKGETLYRTASIKNNQKNLTTLLQNGPYKYPANIPPMPWKDNIKPNSPGELNLSTSDSLKYILSWNSPLKASDGDTAFYYNVYSDNKLPVDISDVKNIVKFRVTGDTSVTIDYGSIPKSNIYFTVTAYDKGYNESEPSNTVGIIISSVNDVISENGYEIYQNYPNPFNPSTEINYKLAASGKTSLIVYNILGKEAAVLVDEFQEKGNHQVKFDAAGLSSGIYFYVIKSGGFTAAKKMILLK